MNLLVWCCLEFGPHMTPLVHSSYADFLMISLGLLGYLLALPKTWIISAFVVQIIDFAVLWVWSPPYLLHTVMLQIPLLVFGVVIALGLILKVQFQGKLELPCRES